jgi:uncharacterized protein YhaN
LRLDRLRLIAFGSFTNVELDLSAGGAHVHVIYGKNEAGKSTALRAITGLLYGIARNTPDAHVHRMPELRVGGTLRGPDGATLDVVRRKGKDNTLLDSEGRPLDESNLTRLFGGVSQEQFLGMFGLDHESLRRGGEALLLGRGHVGESLFGAAMGGGELHRVLRELAAEADALFTPRGHTRPLNEALRAVVEAEKRTREQSMSPDSMMEQTSGLAELRRDQKECEAARQRLHLERTKLERLRRALPILAKRKAATERRRELGDAAVLPANATAARADQVRIIAETEREIARLRAHLDGLAARRKQLVFPESLVLFDEMPLDLGRRLGSHLQSLTELPRLRSEIEEQEEAARSALYRAGRETAVHEAMPFAIDPATQATVHKLALEEAKWREGKLHTQRSIGERRGRHAALSARRDALPPRRDTAGLKKAISRAERDGQLEEHLARARAERARLDERARAELGALDLGDRSWREAIAMAVPALETVERFAESWASQARDARQMDERKNANKERLEAIKRDIDALERSGHVPTERDLAAARERRDLAWQDLRARLVPARAAKGRAKTPAAPSDIAVYETSVRAADEMADRLRREAARVSRLAALSADRDACLREIDLLGQKERAIAEQKERDHGAWRALWRPLGVEPRPPLEMKSWLLRHAALVRAGDALREADTSVEELQVTIERHRQRLEALLAPLDASTHATSGASPRETPLSLAELLDRAEEMALTIDASSLERERLDREIAEESEQMTALLARDKEQDIAKTELDRAWHAAVAPLGLDQRASPEQVTATIELLEKATHHADQAAIARRRAAALEREAITFRADVERLAENHAPDLVQVPTDRAAAELIDRYQRGKIALAARNELDRQLEDASRQLERQRARQVGATASVEEMMRIAGADSLESLERAERSSDEIRALDLDLLHFDEELEVLGGAAALSAEAGDGDIDAVTVRLADIDVEIEQLRESASMIDRRIGSAEAGLKDLEDPKARAAEAAADAEAALARARDLADRYIRARTAHIVLAREIECYRQKNQGPILSRASELFRRLTLGSFAALRTDFDEDDQPVLRGVRSGSVDVGVDAMSDGTRDQLYLALRAATLERYADQGNPMPVVLDDILVHFDDDRARAALALLGELSEHMQVLFFTHHSRLVELARETVPSAKLSVRELSESEPRHASVGAATPALLGSARK